MFFHLSIMRYITKNMLPVRTTRHALRRENRFVGRKLTTVEYWARLVV